MESVKGLLSEMEEAGTKTIRLGATQRFKEAAAGPEEAVPGGTTRLAKVESDHALETNTPTLDVVLSKHINPSPAATLNVSHDRLEADQHSLDNAL